MQAEVRKILSCSRRKAAKDAAQLPAATTSAASEAASAVAQHSKIVHVNTRLRCWSIIPQMEMVPLVSGRDQWCKYPWRAAVIIATVNASENSE